MVTCKACNRYNREKDKCEIYGNIISVLCCKDFEKKNAKKKITFLFIKGGIVMYKYSSARDGLE